MKNKPLLIVAAALAGLFIISRRSSAAGAIIIPSQPGASLAQQAADAARNNAIINALGSVGGWLSSSLQPSVVTPEARAAVRAGDDYYTGQVSGTVAGSWFEQVAADSAAWAQAGYNNSPSGDPYNAEATYLQGGYGDPRLVIENNPPWAP